MEKRRRTKKEWRVNGSLRSQRPEPTRTDCSQCFPPPYLTVSNHRTVKKASTLAPGSGLLTGSGASSSISSIVAVRYRSFNHHLPSDAKAIRPNKKRIKESPDKARLNPPVLPAQGDLSTPTPSVASPPLFSNPRVSRIPSGHPDRLALPRTLSISIPICPRTTILVWIEVSK